MLLIENKLAPTGSQTQMPTYHIAPNFICDNLAKLLQYTLSLSGKPNHAHMYSLSSQNAHLLTLRFVGLPTLVSLQIACSTNRRRRNFNSQKSISSPIGQCSQFSSPGGNNSYTLSVYLNVEEMQLK